MDFDDLDDQIEQRLAAGEEVACRVIENNQPRTGTVLPLLPRSTRVPSYAVLPDRAQKTVPPYNGKARKERKPVLRLLMIHGAGDNYEQDWYMTEEEAPEDIDCVLYEFPGHGHRKDEPLMRTTQELADECFEAFREAMDTGAFAFLGHSIGALIAILVCKRAREELGVEPVFMVMLERGAANIPLFTEEGRRWLSEEPVTFFKVWNPQIWLLHDKLGEKGKQTLNMWAIDQLMDQEALEIGTHVFKCPLLALQASYSVDNFVFLKDMSPEHREAFEAQRALTPFKEPQPDGSILNGHFPAWTYDDWSKWTEHPSGCKVVKCPDTTHMTVKGDAFMREQVWSALRSVIDTF